MSANISKPKLREKLDSLFVALSGITQELATFVSVTVTGALSAASASITGAATVGGLTTTVGLALDQSSHTYANTTAWTLSAGEQATTVLKAGGTSGGASEIIATPTLDKVFIVKNTSGSNVTIKATGQTGVVVATGATAIVVGNGTDFVWVKSPVVRSNEPAELQLVIKKLVAEINALTDRVQVLEKRLAGQ